MWSFSRNAEEEEEEDFSDSQISQLREIGLLLLWVQISHVHSSVEGGDEDGEMGRSFLVGDDIE